MLPTRGSHLYAACWSICDRNQNVWLAKSALKWREGYLLPTWAQKITCWRFNWMFQSEGYLLPTWARKITCRRFNWMLQSSSGRKWRGANKRCYNKKVHLITWLFPSEALHRFIFKGQMSNCSHEFLIRWLRGHLDPSDCLINFDPGCKRFYKGHISDYPLSNAQCFHFCQNPDRCTCSYIKQSRDINHAQSLIKLHWSALSAVHGSENCLHCQKWSPCMRVAFSKPTCVNYARGGPLSVNHMEASHNSHHVHVTLLVTQPTSPCPTFFANTEPARKLSVRRPSFLHSAQCESWPIRN